MKNSSYKCWKKKWPTVNHIIMMMYVDRPSAKHKTIRTTPFKLDNAVDPCDTLITSIKLVADRNCTENADSL